MKKQSKQQVEQVEQVEQVSLEFIVDNAHQTFVKTILSTRTKVLLTGGFVDKASAIKAYLAKTKPHIDRRKKLNEEDARYVDAVERYASDAWEYVDWVRSEDRQPVWREALVGYCTAFENCLKAIAVAFSISDSRRSYNVGTEVETEVLHDISLAPQPADFVALKGAVGCGQEYAAQYHRPAGAVDFGHAGNCRTAPRVSLRSRPTRRA